MPSCGSTILLSGKDGGTVKVTGGATVTALSPSGQLNASDPLEVVVGVEPSRKTPQTNQDDTSDVGISLEG